MYENYNEIEIELDPMVVKMENAKVGNIMLIHVPYFIVQMFLFYYITLIQVQGNIQEALDRDIDSMKKKLAINYLLLLY